MALGLAPAVIALAICATTLAQTTSIDDETLADRPIATLLFKGLDRVKEREILNNVRVAAGQPFDPKAIRNDVSTLYRLGQFGTIQASATVLADGSVELHHVRGHDPLTESSNR